MYGIINKQTKEFFAGFKGSKPVFTSDKAKAWSKTRNEAKAQASLLHRFDFPVQQKPVAL